MVRGDWIKPGAVVIDVGINRVERARLVRKLLEVGAVVAEDHVHQRAHHEDEERGKQNG